MKITVLAPNTAFTHLYSCLPFLLDKGRRFHLTSDWEWVLKSDRSKALILVRWFQGPPHQDLVARRKLLEQLRQKYEHIIYFDDDDSASSPVLDVLPFVDRLWKKQIYRDRTVYTRTLRGNRLFTEFYWQTQTFDHSETPYPLPENTADLAKLRTAWNLGIGSYPLRHRREKASEILFRIGGGALSHLPFHRPRRSGAVSKLGLCQARFSPKGYSPPVSFQRSLFLGLVQGNSQVLSGFVPKAVYAKELRQAKAVLSPFGWGEVCYRDFEAVLAGALAIKPDMSHLETFPDVYHPDLSVGWDGKDLMLKITETLAWTPFESGQRVDWAWDQWSDAWRALPERLDALLTDWLGSKAQTDKSS